MNKDAWSKVGGAAISCRLSTSWSTSIRPLTPIIVGAGRLGAEGCFAPDRTAHGYIVLTQITLRRLAYVAAGSRRIEIARASAASPNTCSTTPVAPATVYNAYSEQPHQR